MRTSILLFALIACGGDDPPADTDTGTSSGTLCEQQSEPLTWDNFAGAFFESNCQPCHATDSADRNGAPEEIYFDTEADVQYLEFAILNAATGQNAFMPPEDAGIDVSDEDRQKLQAYLTCF